MHLDRSADNIERYKATKKIAKRTVSEARGSDVRWIIPATGYEGMREEHLQNGQKPREEDEGHHPNKMH
jgi:hypothetical protein